MNTTMMNMIHQQNTERLKARRAEEARKKVEAEKARQQTILKRGIRKSNMNPDRKLVKKVDGRTRSISPNQLYTESISKGLSPQEAYTKHLSVFGNSPSLKPTSHAVYEASMQAQISTTPTATLVDATLAPSPSYNLMADSGVINIAPEEPPQELEDGLDLELVESKVEEKEEAGLSTTTKVGIGIGAIALVGTVFYFVKMK